MANWRSAPVTSGGWGVTALSGFFEHQTCTCYRKDKKNPKKKGPAEAAFLEKGFFTSRGRDTVGSKSIYLNECNGGEKLRTSRRWTSSVYRYGYKVGDKEMVAWEYKRKRRKGKMGAEKKGK